ncbi:F-box only protein 13-like isoform X1 [Aristolochia californica]|uniref:F-box only protein 13-like isoform X1 n=2 Tax=Aristolochia californica TaxID=171875 RepID=UPI0035E0A9EC
MIEPYSVSLFTQSMEQDQNMSLTKTRKRKAAEVDHFSLDELNQDLLEGVLSWLPTSSFLRLCSVCKRWSSIATSQTFKLACSRVPTRDPWFFMVDPHLDQSIVFDTTEKNWKNLNYPSLLRQTQNAKSIPVASSGGLVCFRTVSGNFIISNPVTGACRELPSAFPAGQTQAIQAIAMHSTNCPSYRLVLVYGEFPHLSVKVYDSDKNQWEDEFSLSRKASQESDSSGDETVYFLSKAGDVIATNMQRSPSKQYSSVITVKGGEEVIYFLSFSGTVVACNLAQRTFSEYPRLLPVFFEYSIDLVECGGELLVVVLSEFLESATLRVWKFSEREKSWHHVAAMPPAMSHDFYGKKADINCVGCGDLMLICVNSGEFSGYVLCNLISNEWIELPKCVLNGKSKEFMSAFAFEPRIEACL